MIELKVKRDGTGISIPKYKLGQKTYDEIGKVASNGIVLNIKSSKQYDGTAIKENATSTKNIKRRYRRLWQGRAAPLIDKKHRFIKTGQGGSWRYWARDDQVTVEAGSEELRRLSRYVQRKGYTGWLGLNKKAVGLVSKVVRRRVLEILADASRKSRR